MNEDKHVNSSTFDTNPYQDKDSVDAGVLQRHQALILRANLHLDLSDDRVRTPRQHFLEEVNEFLESLDVEQIDTIEASKELGDILFTGLRLLNDALPIERSDDVRLMDILSLNFDKLNRPKTRTER